MIKFKKITKEIAGRKVLDTISFNVERGSCVALLGESGSGKSTLIRILMGLVKSTSGIIEVDGKIVSSNSSLKAPKNFGYVIQSGGLFPHLTAKENVLLAIREKLSQYEIADKLANIAEICHFHKEKFSCYPIQLSGGEKQRVALMRALITNPEFIILDEPLGALDPITRAGLQDELKGIFYNLKKTVIIVTHDVAEASFFADKIVMLREGCVVMEGAIKELCHSGNDYVKAFMKATRVLEAV